MVKQMNDIPEDYMASEVESRLFAEENGLYDIDEDKVLSCEQGSALHHAMSTLYDLAKETNSTISELLKYNGYAIIQNTGRSYPMMSNMVYDTVYGVQRAYGEYYMRNRREPNKLLMHSSLFSRIALEIGSDNGGLKANGYPVIVVEDEDLFKNGQMFKWISVSEIDYGKEC